MIFQHRVSNHNEYQAFLFTFLTHFTRQRVKLRYIIVLVTININKLISDTIVFSYIFFKSKKNNKGSQQVHVPLLFTKPFPVSSVVIQTRIHFITSRPKSCEATPSLEFLFKSPKAKQIIVAFASSASNTSSETVYILSDVLLLLPQIITIKLVSTTRSDECCFG